MPRARNVKPGLFKNESLGDLSVAARLLFVGLWCLADREGRLEDRPRRIKAEIFPFDGFTESEVDLMLDSLAGAGFITRYIVENARLIGVINFSKHQNPHFREKPSVLPPPPEAPERTGLEKVVPSLGLARGRPEASPGLAPVKPQSGPSQASLIPDSLIPDSLKPDSLKPDIPEPRAARCASADSGFETFWKAYPKKVGKGAAEAAWRKLKPDAELQRSMLETVERAKRSDQWQRDGGQYIPNPSTWLNQRRWEDEPPAVSGTPKRPWAIQRVETEQDDDQFYREMEIIAKRRLSGNGNTSASVTADR